MRCKDTWNRPIPDNKLKAYKQLLSDGTIRNPHVIYARAESVTIVTYESYLTHYQVLEKMRELL